MAAAVEQGGSLDLLVTCAGIIRDNLLHKMSDDDWDAVIDTHLKGTFYAVRAAQKQMVEQKSGKMVLDLVDLGAREPRPDELLDRQGRAAGHDEDARDRARAVRDQRELRRAGLHRDGDDPADGRPDRRAVRPVPGAASRRRLRSGGSASPRMSPGRSPTSARRMRATSRARSSTCAGGLRAVERLARRRRRRGRRTRPPATPASSPAQHREQDRVAALATLPLGRQHASEHDLLGEPEFPRDAEARAGSPGSTLMSTRSRSQNSKPTRVSTRSPRSRGPA